MSRERQYFLGFKTIKSPLCSSLPSVEVKAATAVAKGVVIGYSTGALALSAFAAGVLGVSAAAKDNSTGAIGDLKVPYKPVDQNEQLIVPVGSGVLVTKTAIGTVVDLFAGGASVDITDTTVVNFGFKVEAIDDSVEAQAVNSSGFVIGRIITVST